ncbi:MAG: CoA transferase [Chloroflexi bacterium]|nr:CoA transferase [Chloroflexota bacterium]
MERLPLHGVRVLDLTMAWAGPYATRLLADMGAEVIKIEAVNNWDLLRAFTGQPPNVERVWNKSPYFNHVNRNKYGCALDLSHPRGKELFLRLVAVSDAVIENFRSEVMENLGLTYEVLSQVKPQLIFISMPSHGKTGPEAHFIAYGTNVEQLSGLCHLTGYADGPPQKTGISYGDPMAGVAAAGALALARWQRRRRGRGQYVEVAQRENLINVIGEYKDERFADVVSRYRNQDALDAIIAAWTKERTKEQAADALAAAGVPASPVLSVPEVFQSEHLRSRRFFETVAHADAGTWEMEGPHWRFSETPGHVRLPAPCFGEHNDYVLRGLLGLSEEEVEALRTEGITGETPNWAVHE